MQSDSALCLIQLISKPDHVLKLETEEQIGETKRIF